LYAQAPDIVFVPPVNMHPIVHGLQSDERGQRTGDVMENSCARDALDSQQGALLRLRLHPSAQPMSQERHANVAEMAPPHFCSRSRNQA
jgi:hypothetical protein